MQIESMQRAVFSEQTGNYIYIACPWTPKGGGMFKVADYLIQAQDHGAPGAAALRPLDTRGGGNALYSFWILATALAKLLRGDSTDSWQGFTSTWQSA